jgi:hypothetical protein
MTSKPHKVMRRWSLVFRRIRHKPLVGKALGGGKWFFVLFLVIIPSIVVASILIKRTHTSYHFVTGPKGSTYAELGPQVAAALNKPDRLEEFLHLNIIPDFVPEESCGPFENIYAINHEGALLGFAEDGLPLYFEPIPGCPQVSRPRHAPFHTQNTEIPVRVLMPLFLSSLHVVAHKTAAYSDIRKIPPHTKVYLGPEGSAAAFLAQSILLHYGIVVDQPEGRPDAQQAIQQLLEKKIEVSFFLDRLHEDKLRHLLQRDDVKLLTIEHAQGLKILYPYLEVLTIPAETYRSSEKDIVTVGTKTLLVTSTKLNEIEVFKIVQKLAQYINQIIKDIPYNVTRVTDSDPQKDLFYPLHEGAIRFYTHDPPFFMDPRTIAAIGTYFWVLYAGYGFIDKYLREYRANRFIYAVDRAARAFSQYGDHSRAKRYEYYTRRLRAIALSLLRRRRIHLDDFKHVDAYINGYL